MIFSKYSKSSIRSYFFSRVRKIMQKFSNYSNCIKIMFFANTHILKKKKNHFTISPSKRTAKIPNSKNFLGKPKPMNSRTKGKRVERKSEICR